jgi:hypothetical protein
MCVVRHLLVVRSNSVGRRPILRHSYHLGKGFVELSYSILPPLLDIELLTDSSFPAARPHAPYRVDRGGRAPRPQADSGLPAR